MSASSIAMAHPDLGAVDELCQLVLVAQRLGCTVKLAGASDELRALLDLSGVSELVIERHHDPDPDIHPDETDLP